MRTGACTVQQALTSEAASVLKHALGLARRRGHAQVTPLHVAATLLSSTREAASLFRRACLRSHPHHRGSPHPLQCRALELCFNVALNRLPTLPPPSTGPLVPASPTLSNALIAALKRAQAHQRRGCIEQQQQLQQQQQQQQAPLLAMKVELEQLIISILDDPSVSRVMKEAGFSSICVKSKLEEDPSASSPTLSSAVSLEARHHHLRELIHPSSGFWPPSFFRPPPYVDPCSPPLLSSTTPRSSSASVEKDDMRLLLEALLGKTNKTRSTGTSAVVVGDSVTYSEGLVVELARSVERGEVPEELRTSQFVRFHVSSSRLGLMSRGETEARIAELRRKVGCCPGKEGAIIYVGDLKWAAVERGRDGEYRPADHLVAELGRLMSELTSCSKVRFMAVATLQTYMRFKRTRPLLEGQWGLHPVFVPSGGFGLSLCLPSDHDSRAALVRTLEVKAQLRKADAGEEEKLTCCPECTRSFEREAAIFNPGSSDAAASHSFGAKDGAASLPFWSYPRGDLNAHQDVLAELRRKWNRMCRSLHQDRRQTQTHSHAPLQLDDRSLSCQNDIGGSSHSSRWPDVNANFFSVAGRELWPPGDGCGGGDCNFIPRLLASGSRRDRSGRTLLGGRAPQLDPSVGGRGDRDAGTILALGSTVLADSAASPAEQKQEAAGERLELRQRLQKNIPWQSETIGSVVEALVDKKLGATSTNGSWLLLQGSDAAGKGRLSRVVAEFLCGSADMLVQVDMSSRSERCATRFREVLGEALAKDPRCVFLIEHVDRAEADCLAILGQLHKTGSFGDAAGGALDSSRATFVLSTGDQLKYEPPDGVRHDEVIKLRLHVTGEEPAGQELKRKAPSDDLVQTKAKSPRTSCESTLDLNLSVNCTDEKEGEEDEAVPSDLTQETADSRVLLASRGFLGLISARFAMDICPDRARRLSDHFLRKLRRTFEEAGGARDQTGCLSLDVTVAAELAKAAGSFLDHLFDEWLGEVFQSGLQAVGRKGAKLRLLAEGKEGKSAEWGFRGSVLPKRIILDL